MEDLLLMIEVLKYFNYKLCKKSSSLDFKILNWYSEKIKIDKCVWSVDFNIYLNEKLNDINIRVLTYTDTSEGIDENGAFTYADESRRARKVIINLIARKVLSIIDNLEFREIGEDLSYVNNPSKCEEAIFYANAILSKKY